jgi:hypothetical protein
MIVVEQWPPYPWGVCPLNQSVLVVVLIVVVTATIVSVAGGIAPAPAVAVIGAAGVAATEIATRLPASLSALDAGRAR